MSQVTLTMLWTLHGPRHVTTLTISCHDTIDVVVITSRAHHTAYVMTTFVMSVHYTWYVMGTTEVMSWALHEQCRGLTLNLVVT